MFSFRETDGRMSEERLMARSSVSYVSQCRTRNEINI
jgi:hypothetical protein